jgi:hypothetical protein
VTGQQPGEAPGHGWVVALVPYDDEAKIHWNGARVMQQRDASERERKRLHEALLAIPWLAPKVRRAVMAELGLSLRKQKRDIEHGGTVALRWLIDERKKVLRKRGQRPRGGVHEKAVEEIAREQGMTVAALRKRLQRDRQRWK